MVAKNVRVEFVHGPYDGGQGEFNDVLLRSTIELPTPRLGIEVEETRDGSLAVYKLDTCEQICTPRISMTVLRYQHMGFKTVPTSAFPASDGDPKSASRMRRLFTRIWQ